MSKLDKFTNSTYRVLAYMYDKKLNNNLVVATQGEMAKDLDMSRPTVNRIVNELCKDGYIDPDGPHFGRYIITEKTISFIKTLRSVDKT